MVLELDGVRTELTPGDAARLRAELLSTLRPILAEGEPPFDLTDVKIVAQQLQVEQESRRRRAAVKFLPQVEQEVAPADSSSTHRRELQTISGVHTEVILVGNCAIVEGVDNCEPQLVQQRAKSAVTDESATILQNLQEETSIRDYFDRVDGFGVNAASDSLITINVTEILAETNDIPSLEEFSNDTTDEEEAPWWIWVLVGGVAGVFAVGSIWASRAIQERNREAILRQAFEENHRQSMAGVSRSMMSKGGNSDHSNGMGGSGTSQPQTDFDDEPDSAEPESTPRGSTAATEDGSSDNVATTVVSTTGVGAVEVTSLMSDDHSTDTPASNAVPVATTVMASDIPSAAEEIPDTQSPSNGSATGKLVVSAPKEP
uniref:Uncharacterized protein n=1 Tax=Entomoneis paludosa TaxID=265537 RepID=A0A7S2YTN6_9STRA